MLDTVLEQLATGPFVNTQPVKDLGIFNYYIYIFQPVQVLRKSINLAYLKLTKLFLYPA